MLTIWIIHRDPHHRNALARVAAAGDGAMIGGPSDARFADAEVPDAVVLGLGGDFEEELEFVHRFGARLAESNWLLLVPPGDEAQARRLFDTLDARYLAYPGRPAELRRALRDGVRERRADSLSSRRERDELRERFGRWFGDLDLPAWMRALDPRAAAVPVLIRGEEGTGRGLLARYIHTFGHTGAEAFLHVGCRDIGSARELADRLEAATPITPGRAATVWLEDVDRLPLSIQRELRDWIEFGPPRASLRGCSLRFMAGAGDEADLEIEPGLEPRLAEALAVLDLRIPSLRERGHGIGRFVDETSQAWFRARGETPRPFAPKTIAFLAAQPWPGNLHELESLVVRTLTLSSADPVLPGDLHFGADAGPWGDEPDARLQAPPFAGGSSSPESRDILAFFETETAESTSSPPISEPPVGERPPRQTGATTEGDESNLRRVIQAVAHAVRNPLVSIRTFAELLPERYDDPEFRGEFRELVGQDVARIDEAVGRLQAMLELPNAERQPVDLAHLLDKLLEEHADEIRSRRLLVLKELDHGLPHAYGDPMLLRDAFAGLLERAFAAVKDQGDIYIASKHHEAGRAGEPTVRILLRYSVAEAPGSPQGIGSLPGSENLAGIMAQTIVQSLGGSFTADSTDADEYVVIIDLPAPGPE